MKKEDLIWYVVGVIVMLLVIVWAVLGFLGIVEMPHARPIRLSEYMTEQFWRIPGTVPIIPMHPFIWMWC